MLGTLPSTYLKWVSNNLRARDFEEWANLADQVLIDPVYKDRLEWEFAEKFLNGDVLMSNSMSQSAVSELLELSQRFGWDNEDKVGWSKVDFKLLGTSKGGRIPRVKEGRHEERMMMKSDHQNAIRSPAAPHHAMKWGGVDKGKRGERRERVRMKRGVSLSKMNVERFGNGNGNVGDDDEGRKNDENVEAYNPFPGRESLLKKVLSRRNTIS